MTLRDRFRRSICTSPGCTGHEALVEKLVRNTQEFIRDTFGKDISIEPEEEARSQARSSVG